MAAEGSGDDPLSGCWMDWPVIERWEDGQYRELIVPCRQWLNWVVRRGPDADAVRAGAVLIAAGSVTPSSVRALAARFPQRDGRR